ncbi:helix-turn-helix domain-containing protein [Isoptericola variabilis]|uniref:helix-turn-helix domain-containing protein n=1 Tax=Isoptericola variabilis TaxID=139208 RepID=UPI003D1D13B1
MSRTTTLPEPYWSVADTAHAGQVNHMTVRRAIDRGDLPAYRIGRVLRIRPEDAQAWITAKPATPSGGANDGGAA